MFIEKPALFCERDVHSRVVFQTRSGDVDLVCETGGVSDEIAEITVDLPKEMDVMPMGREWTRLSPDLFHLQDIRD